MPTVVIFDLLMLLHSRILVPTHLEGGGTIYSNGFFCSANFDRSIYSSYRVVSRVSKKPFSVEYGIKKIFLNFVIYRELSRFEILWVIDGSPVFLFTFSGISPKISSIFNKNFIKIVYNSTVDLIFSNKKVFFDYFDIIFLAQILVKCLKIQPFSTKLARSKLFSPLWLILPKVHIPKTTNTAFVN